MGSRRDFLQAIAGVSCLRAQDELPYQVERVAIRMGFTEGPAWSTEGFLLFSDTIGNKVHKFTPGKGLSVHREAPEGAMGNAFDRDGRLYTCEFRGRRVTRTDKRGRTEVLAERFEGKRLNAPNDIVVRRDGHVWFTDPAFGNQQDTREIEFNGLFHVTPKGEIEAVARSEGRLNGLALSADGRTLYVTNSDERSVRAFALDRGGKATNERTVISRIDGVPGGLKTDESGNLYIAARELVVYSPDGKKLREFEMSEPPSNCAFGDGDMGTLYVTARTSVYRVRAGATGASQY